MGSSLSTKRDVFWLLQELSPALYRLWVQVLPLPPAVQPRPLTYLPALGVLLSKLAVVDTPSLMEKFKTAFCPP
jgi:hypothetical protein